MNIFDLLFVVVFLGSMLSLALAGLAFLRGHRAAALLSLRRLATFWGFYLLIVVVVSLVSPRRELHIGDMQCWDDWCIAVANVRRAPADNHVSYEVTFRLSSRAKRRAQRENGIRVHVVDRGHCYEPVVDASNVPFNILVQPQQAIDVTRVYELPPDAQQPVVFISHSGSFPGCVIIGDSSSLLHKRTVVRLD